MRVVLVQAGFGAGGAEKVVNLLAHHRKDQGDEVDVVALNAAHARSYFPYKPTVCLHALGRHMAPQSLRPFVRAMRLRRLLRQLEPEIVISFLTKVNVTAAFATLGLDTATIMSERNNFKIQKMNAVWRLLSAASWARATRLVMQTEQARASLPPRLRRRAAVIPNPVPALPLRDPPPRSALRFVAVGRLDRQKGFDLLLSAFAGVVQKLPTASLVIFGEGPERASLEWEAERLGIASAVELPGVTNSPQDWLDAGDIFVLSSRFEGFPNVLLEALTAAMPVVAFDCPWGPAEILGSVEAYPLVPAGDVEGLSDALVRTACDADLRQRLGTLGPSIAARYSQAVVFAEWDELIDPGSGAGISLQQAAATAGA